MHRFDGSRQLTRVASPEFCLQDGVLCARLLVNSNPDTPYLHPAYTRIILEERPQTQPDGRRYPSSLLLSSLTPVDADLAAIGGYSRYQYDRQAPQGTARRLDRRPYRVVPSLNKASLQSIDYIGVLFEFAVTEFDNSRSLLVVDAPQSPQFQG